MRACATLGRTRFGAFGERIQNLCQAIQNTVLHMFRTNLKTKGGYRVPLLGVFPNSLEDRALPALTTDTACSPACTLTSTILFKATTSKEWRLEKASQLRKRWHPGIKGRCNGNTRHAVHAV